MSKPIDPEADGAKMSFKDDMSYGDYLQLDGLLSSQKPISEAHDEMLFIIQHQTSELWMRLALHELNAARDLLAEGSYQPSFKLLARVSRIFEQLNSAWDVLRTMTPSDYTKFRDTLGASSGFQSYQYRMVEYVLGNRNKSMMAVHEHQAETYAELDRELERPTIYHLALSQLSRETGYIFKPDIFNLEKPHAADEQVMQAWTHVYEQPDQFWNLYELAEKLVDLEDYFRRWRFNHVTTVERIIGFKRGTGGTSGVTYLRKMLDVVLFPELWNLRGNL